MGKKKHIIEVDRQQYEATYIGKGQYSKVYRVGDRVVLYTRGDCAKEVLAMFQYDRMAHLPELIRHDNIILKNRDYNWYVFSSPYYRNVTTKDKSAWNLMQKIIMDYDYFYSYELNRTFKGIYLMQEFVNNIKKDPHMIRSVIRALNEIIQVAGNCGNEVGFDFHKGNFGVNEYGTLIFRDVIWVRS